MSASKTDSRVYTHMAPADLRWVDGREQPAGPGRDSIDRVLSLVNRVCGPDSEVARMLGIDGVSA